MRERSNNPKTVYAIRCRETGRVYIGCSAQFETRVQQHFSELARGNKTMRMSKYNRVDTPWQQDYNKYGRGAFDVYILRGNVPADKAAKVENKYILEYRANELDFGYNIRPSNAVKIVVTAGAPPLPVLSQ